MSRAPSRNAFWFVLAILFSPPAHAADSRIRSERSLDGPWQFRATNPVSEWKWITVPSAMQSHEGMAWHGTGEYRRYIKPIDVPPGHRVLLHFTAAATHAEVFWNGERIGEHLGGWTPFRFDITDTIRSGEVQQHELVVKLDERVGHNTQGFLPIVQPHFGGIWRSVGLLTVPADHLNDLDLTVPEGTSLPLWSPQTPSLKDVRIEHESGDQVVIRTARRTVEVRGDQLFLNGQPLQIRGVLNWGYYPPTLEPSPSDDVWRADLRRIRSWGFNLMKCCLWVPSQRQLQIADEEGMLIWMEYPTWHPQLTPQHLGDLTREFEEFFAHVRNHPSVVLHSLTCETGPSADINVLKELTKACKRMIPGAVVEDDSSWIEWNRVTDFYDDHPYGNNHTWVRTLDRLKAYDALGTKPLVLGEAIGADTWTPVDQLARQVGSERPYWLPYHFQANAHWLYRLAEAGHSVDPDRLVDDSKRYAMLMRKFQMETFRREVPHGGYVVSVLRDFPLAAMGLIDYQGREKWRADQWQWHGEQMLVLTTPNDARTFTAGGLLEAQVQTASEVDAQQSGLVLRLISKQGDDVLFDDEATRLKIRLPDVSHPTCYELQAELKHNDVTVAANRWPLWIIPKPAGVPAGVIVANHFSKQLLADLQAGAKVLLLPDKQPGSLPLQSHWFLRGAPVVFDHAALQKVPRELLIETQHFDLASDVIPNIGYLDQIDPLLLLWDNHDIRDVRTHALAFATNVGRGRLLVSAMNHDGETNAVGAWLLGEMAAYLAEGPRPIHSLSPEMIEGMRSKIMESKVDLSKSEWAFQPDHNNVGVAEGWHQVQMAPSKWTPIRIDRAWEGQGHAGLDGWAWYRLSVDVPADFAGQEGYLQFTGVDDYYELFVNGVKAGTGGDIATKQTAFEERKSHRITPWVQPGQPLSIAIRVYDWYGAGGIFRPIFLTTAPETPAVPSFIK